MDFQKVNTFYPNQVGMCLFEQTRQLNIFTFCHLSLSLGAEDPWNIVNSISDGKVAVKDFLPTLEKPLSKEQLRNSTTDGEYFSYLSGFLFRGYLSTPTKFF